MSEEVIKLQDLDSKLVVKCRNLVKQNKTEEMLLLLRTEGYSKAESMWVTHELMSITFGEARAIVHDSVTWKDYHDGEEKANNEFLDYLDSL